MTRLEELIYSLATVIVRYHDSQAIEPKLVVPAELTATALRKKSHERAVEIIQNKETDYVSYLEGKITACTKGYHAREQYLLFLLKEISFLKEQLNRKTPFEHLELQTFQGQLTQLFIDFRQLLNLKNGVIHKATENSSKGNEPKELSGLLNTRYVGGKYCNSGQLLIDEVLFVLHMTTEDSDAELKQIAANICSEHQTQLEHQSEKQKKVAQELEHEKQISSSLEAQKSELGAAHSLAMSEKDKAHQLVVEQLKSELQKAKEAPKPSSESVDKNQSQQVIEELQRELEKTKVDLQKAQGEILTLKVRTSPYFYTGFAGLMLNQNRTNPRIFPQLQPSQTPDTSSQLDADASTKLAIE